MNLVVLQQTPNHGWVMTYNGNYIRSWTPDQPSQQWPLLGDIMQWMARNPEGWNGQVSVQIIGTLDGVLGSE